MGISPQECIRYNRVISTLRASLADIVKALRGEVVMTQELEELGASLFNNQARDQSRCARDICADARERDWRAGAIEHAAFGRCRRCGRASATRRSSPSPRGCPLYVQR